MRELVLTPRFERAFRRLVKKNPALPPEVVAKTQAKYLEAYEKLTGRILIILP
jgi:phosphoribosylaminoimidazole-succinocarboxamide synthase